MTFYPHRLEVRIFIKVCAVADQVKDERWDDHIQDDAQELSPQGDFHVDFLCFLRVEDRDHPDLPHLVLGQEPLALVVDLVHHHVGEGRVGRLHLKLQFADLDIEGIPLGRGFYHQKIFHEITCIP